MRLFDAHCHLQDQRLAPDLDGVLRRGREAGVYGAVCCGTAETDWTAVAALTAQHTAILPAFGLHPWYVAGRSRDWWPTLAQYLRETPHASIGEIGLDHALRTRNDAEQFHVCRRQLGLALRLDRPASIHCRNAWGALLQLLRDIGPFPAGIVLHSFNGAPELVPQLMRCGAYFSFSGVITFSDRRKIKRAAAAVPGDRLLVETDAPDLPCCRIASAHHETGAAGRPASEPAHLPEVVRALADARATPVERIAQLTCANARRLFAAAGGANEQPQLAAT